MPTASALFSTLLLLFSSISIWAQERPPSCVPLPPVLEEVSGLVYQHPDSLWWHTDSGGEASLYRTNEQGELLEVAPLPNTINRDWEDLTSDDGGNFYVGDFGDNRRRRTDLRIYRFDPSSGNLDSILFYFPENRHFDTEAFFWHQDSLHLFTKSAMNVKWRTTYHYVLPATPGEYQAILRDSLQLRKRSVTAAAIDPLTGDVVLLAYHYTKWLGFIPHSAANVYYLRNYPDHHYLQGDIRAKRISFLLATQYESVDFLNDRYILTASEKTAFIRARGKRVRRR